MTFTDTDFTNQFLIAMPGLHTPQFHHSVTYVCEHNKHGAMGIIINQLLDVKLGEVLNQMQISVTLPNINEQAVYLGGPVQPERGFVLHPFSGRWNSMLPSNSEIAITTSKDILNSIAHGEGPDNTLIALGYAGWGPGQLEKEMVENAWLSGPADESILFHTPSEQRWQAAAALIGVDLNFISNDIGHA